MTERSVSSAVVLFWLLVSSFNAPYHPPSLFVIIKPSDFDFGWSNFSNFYIFLLFTTCWLARFWFYKIVSTIFNRGTTNEKKKNVDEETINGEESLKSQKKTRWQIITDHTCVSYWRNNTWGGHIWSNRTCFLHSSSQTRTMVCLWWFCNKHTFIPFVDV